MEKVQITKRKKPNAKQFKRLLRMIKDRRALREYNTSIFDGHIWIQFYCERYGMSWGKPIRKENTQNKD